MALQLRRGTNAERLAMTPVNGELIFVTDYELVTTSVTSINTTTDTLTTTAAHGLSVNQQVKYIGATLNGLTADQVYFVKTAPTITTFTLSTTLAGSTLDITGSFTVDLVFAKTPTTAAGVPLGEGVAILWIGDGATVGGVIAASMNLDDLLDVEITAVAEGNTLYYDATTGLWKNTAIITVDDVTNNVTLLNDLAVNGGDITTTQTTASLFNTTATTINVGNGANTEVNIGSPTGGSKVVIKPETIVGINATQAVFNTVASTVNAFGFANTLNMGSATSLTTLGNNLSINGTELKINADGAGSPADGFVYFNGTNESLKWNQADSRFEFSDQLYISQTDIPAILERRNVTADINSPLEFKSGLRLMQRVTDAPDNDTTSAGPGITFTRTSGATATTERLFASLGSVWDGATQTVDWGFNWSNDNFTEPTPGNFPGTYRLLRMGSYDTEFYNNSLYIDYTALGTQHTATSITGGNTLVFGSAHGFSSGDRIQYVSTTQNGLTQNAYYYVIAAGLTATQCQLGLTSTGSAIALTNGTGLTLNFGDMINRVGVNTDTPNYTLDVNGDANVETILTVPSITTLTGDDLTITAFAGRDVTISTTTATDPVTIVRNTAVTGSTGTTRTLTLRADSTGTPVIGFGNTIEFETESTPGTFVQSAYIENKSTGDNAGVLDEFEMSFGVMSAGVSTERMVLDNLGNLQIDGDLTVTGTNINTGVTDTIIQIDKTSSDTAVSNRALKLLSTSTGTPTVGFGTALGFQGQTGVSTIKDAAYIAVSSTDITPGSEDFTMSFGLMQNGAAFTNKMELNSAGDLTIDGILDTIRIDIDGQATIDTATLTTTATATVSLLTSTRNAITGLINIIQGSNVHCVNVTVLRVDATTAMLTTYGEMYNTSSLASFTADVSGGDLRLRVTPASATSTVFSVVRTSLT